LVRMDTGAGTVTGSSWRVVNAFSSTLAAGLEGGNVDFGFSAMGERVGTIAGVEEDLV